ncbi:MAG: class II glutamine amidotransferase [Candidatus Eisenbacteria sp.]|nr:class II glutamine amidotransferase [Candidatus Eisenbacteria bacterium]
MASRAGNSRPAAWLLLVATVLLWLPGDSAERTGEARRPTAAAAADHACRFWGLVTTAPQDSLLDDHLVSGTSPLRELGTANPDGWGLCFYSQLLQPPAGGYPLTIRGGVPADHEHDPRFAEAVAQMVALVPSRAIAHLRNASTGSTGVPDPHPFTRDGLTFAHNGTIDTTALLGLLTEGTPDYLDHHPPDYYDQYLDSELYLLYVLKLRDQGVEVGGPAPSHALIDALAEAARRVHELDAIVTAANCVAIAGDTLFAMRFDPDDRSFYAVCYRACTDGWEVASQAVGTDLSDWETLPAKSVASFLPGESPLIQSVLPPEMPYLVMTGHTLDDDQAGGSDGNADGGADAGERIELLVTLRNDGLVVASGVAATLATSDTLCQILDAHETFSDLQPESSAVCADDFDLLIDPAAPPGHTIPLMLTMTCTGRPSWVHYFSLVVEAPRIELAALTVLDGAGGNGNGRIDPGETVFLDATLTNTGDEEASGLQAILAIPHPEVTILQGMADLALLPVGAAEALSPHFEIHVAEGCDDPDLLFVSFAVTGDWGQAVTLEAELPIGGFFDDIEEGAGEWLTYIATPDFENQWHRTEDRNFTPGGSWSWVFNDSVTGLYADLADGALVTDTLDLADQNHLRFRHWMDAETSGTHPDHCYDGGIVEMSVNGNAWVQIEPVGGYPYLIREGSTPGPWPAETPVFSGSIAWEEATFDISGFSGTVRFRLRFGSDGEVNAEGWYIDDIEFYGYNEIPQGGLDGGAELLLPAGPLSRPNPFSGSTTIAYRLAASQHVSLRLFDIGGRCVRTLFEGVQPAGLHELAWDGRNGEGRWLGTGVYFCRFESGAATQTRKLVLTH